MFVVKSIVIQIIGQSYRYITSIYDYIMSITYA